MKRHTVHLYREMRLTFTDITADSPEAAAKHVAGLPKDDAHDIDDCEGEDFAALVDVQDDENYDQSVMIAFEAERMRKAAPQLLAALDYLLEQTVDMDLKYGIELSEGEEDARAKALATIATTVNDTPNTSSKSNAAGLPPDPEGMNDNRASWAGHALAAFQQVTGADDEDALCDLLADLMHWCDRNDNRFERALERAKWHYEAETQGELS